MMGSETFIIVALRCSEKRMSFDLASTISFSRNACSWPTDMNAESITSPACSGVLALSVVAAPVAASTCSMRTEHGDAHVCDCSDAKKSPASMWLTCVFDSALHSPILCGFFCAKLLTGAATRRSELPSRSTGLTAEPSTLAYRALIFSSSAFAGSAG